MSDGQGSVSRSMLGIVGLDGSNTELSWKITKGKRSRKSVTGTGRSNLSSEHPKRVEESSGSDTDKIDEPSLADGLGCCVPIKKRRHPLHSPSRNIEQLPPQHGTPSLHSGNFQQLSDNIGLSCNYSGIQRMAGVLEHNSSDMASLSGIALLATAACSSNIDDNPDDVRQDVTEASLTLMKCNDTCNVTTGKPVMGHEKSSSFAEDSSDHILAENNQGTFVSVFSEIDRCHWDLNKVIEEWEVPQEDLVGKKNSVGEVSMEERCLAQSDSVSNVNNVNQVSLAPVDLVTTSFKSKVGGYAHEIDDSKHMGPTLLKNYEQQTSLSEIEGLEKHLNNSQMKDAEEDSQKTSELFEDKTILSAEDLVRKTCKTVDIGVLRKCKDMSTSDISIADQSAVSGGDAMGLEENAIVTDAMDTDIALDHQDHLVSKGEMGKTSISQDSVKTLVDDDHGLSDDTQNISELQVDYESPYEDGELRLPALYLRGKKEIIYDEEENECVDFESDGIVGGEESDLGEYLGSEVVEAGSEGSQAPEKKKYTVPAQISENVTRRNSSLNFKKEVMEENTVVMLKPEGKRHSNQGSGTTDELPIIPLVQDSNDSLRRERKFDHADRFNSRGGSYPREVGGLTMEKSQFDISNVSSKFGDSFSRTGRGRGGADRSMTRGGSSFSHWNYRDSTNRYRSRGPKDHWQQPRTRNAADYIDKFEGDNSYEHDDHQPSKYPSKGIQRPFFKRRSPVESDDYYCDQRRFNPANGYNKRGSFGKYSGGGFGRGRREEEYVDDDESSGRFSGYLSRGERTSQISDMNWKSRSRSRTRSPHTWQSSLRERNLNTRRCSRSRSPPAEFRQESRGHVPFQKRISTERFISPPKARFSPTRNNRWVNDNRKFPNRRSPPPPPPVVRVFRQSQQRFGGQSGRESNNNNNNNNNKSEDNSNEGKQDQRFGLVDHNVRHSGTSNIMRRPRHDDNTSVNCEDDGISNNSEGREMSSFGVDYEESFLSSQNNNRWADDNNDSPFSRNHGMVKRAQKPKQDDYFRSVTRPGRFTKVDDGDWGNNGRKRNLE